MSSESTRWVNGPFQLVSPQKSGDKKDKRAIGAKRVAAEMTIVHNCLIRGINAVYLQCINVSGRGSLEDKFDFANFAFQWAELVNDHHTNEETLLFPDINQLAEVPGLMDGNIDEHKAFHDGLDQYVLYLDKVKKCIETLDGKKLQGIIDGFMPTLRTHLDNEIDTLLLLEKHKDKVDWFEWFEKAVGKMMEHKMKSAQFRTDIFPLTVVLHDKTYSGGVWSDFPPIPFSMELRGVYIGEHQNWWRFAGCDYTSQPKELPFA